MREFIITLDPSRLTQRELREIMNTVQGPARPADCGREFQRFQTQLRYEYTMANEIIQRRYEPNPADNNILRLVLEMLNVHFVEGTEDVRFQVVPSNVRVLQEL